MLYIMRHGQTDWNVIKKIQGRTDTPLNDAGKKMAEEARAAYADLKFDLCFCSPLSRARETAEIFLEGTGTPIFYDERLKEMSFGVCEGEEHVFDHPESKLYPLFFDPANYEAVEEGESLDDLFQRTGAFLDEVILPKLEEGKDILIVAHGALNCSIIGRFRNIPRKDFWSAICGNCELVQLA